MAFMNEAGQQALVRAIEAVEARSRAEVVIVVRPQAGDYLGQELIVGCVAALGILTFLMYSRWEYAPIWFLVEPTLTVAASVAVLRLIPFLRRMFVSEAKREDAVRKAAAASFFEKGVRNTRERTGVLVFVAVFEQRVEILADGGIMAFVPKEQWREAAGLIEAVFHDGGDAVELAERIAQALGPRLARWCEIRPDDTNELPNEVGS